MLLFSDLYLAIKKTTILLFFFYIPTTLSVEIEGIHPNLYELQSEWAIEDSSSWGNQFLNDLGEQYSILPDFFKTLIEKSKCHESYKLSCLRQSELQAAFDSYIFIRMMDIILSGHLAVSVISFIIRPNELSFYSTALIYITSGIICDHLKLNPIDLIFSLAIGENLRANITAHEKMALNILMIIMGEIYLTYYKQNEEPKFLESEQHNQTKTQIETDKLRHRKKLRTNQSIDFNKKSKCSRLEAVSFGALSLDFSLLICQNEDGSGTIQLHEAQLSEYKIHITNLDINPILDVLDSMGITEVLLRW